MIQHEKDIQSLKEALTETKKDERKKDEQLLERAVRLKFLFISKDR